ncbi:MAG: hypothetical protein NZ583_06520, partial [Desulfobacterota bacterium]|nr:hypothetical protein [Thermodesulfobacteriota bacterium]
MMENVNYLSHAILILAFFILFGIALQKFFLPRLAAYASKTPYIVDKAIVTKLKRWIVVFFILFGLIAGMHYVEEEVRHIGIAKKIFLILLS